ncbi:MAG: 16S rRNA (uracil(1498)-N(3))-methyltransferase [Sulfuricella sp.]|nr:16S rRNA (uracil(1498)-N(3))-methyltransferase [Sulfuricella sp.]
MTTPRFYCPEILAQSGTAELPEQAAHHAARVLRLQAGDRVSVFNGRGGEGDARITDIGKRNVTVEIVGWHAVERESPLQVLLAQAISAGEKMDFTLQKAVELGIGNIQPLASERSVVRLSGERAEKRVAHWQGVVIAACEQSGRNRVPEVAPIRPLLDWLGQQDGGLRLMLSPVAEVGLRDLPKPTGNITLLIGPEGGLSPAEAEAAQRYGYTPVRLGARVLRTETAALAALAAMQMLWGDF